MKANYTRLYSDSQGVSHFEDVEVGLTPVSFALSSPPLDLSAYSPAIQWSFLGARPGWNGDWHPSSARNLFVVLSGEWELEAGDGTVRTFSANDVLLVEDTTGQGHRSRVIGEEDSLALLVQLPDT